MAQRRTFKVPRLGRTYSFDPDRAAGGDFRGGDFSGFDLRGLDLRRACFEGANLTGANLRRANLEGADLSVARLDKADLSEANLKGARLWQTRFGSAKTRLTDFRGARNLACRTGQAYNAHIRTDQLRQAITDMNHAVWQRIRRLRRDGLWSLAAIAFALLARASGWLIAPWDHRLTVASFVVLALILLSLAWAHHVRIRRTTYWQG